MTTPPCTRPNCHRHAYNNTPYCRAHAIANGTYQPRTPNHTTLHHIQTLNWLGYPDSAILGATTLSPSTIHDLRTQPNASTRTHKQLQNITPTHILTHTPGHYYVHAWPYARRIRALQSLGYTLKELAEHTGITRPCLGYIANANSLKTPLHQARKIRHLYTQLETSPTKHNPYQHKHTKTYAKPLDWDNIDNPQENPTRQANTGLRVPTHHSHREARMKLTGKDTLGPTISLRTHNQLLAPGAQYL